jgi:hypothetical protein
LSTVIAAVLAAVATDAIAEGSVVVSTYSDTTYKRDKLAPECAIDVREALRFSASARLIASLGRQLRRVKCQGNDFLVDGKVTPTDVADLSLVTAMHEPLFTRDRDWVRTADLPVRARQQVEDHRRILNARGWLVNLTRCRPRGIVGHRSGVTYT